MDLLERMSTELGIDKKYIVNCSKRNNLYAQYYIKKKNGKKRKILQPSKELKVLQYWIGKNIFGRFPISEYSMAYQKECSVKRNAQYHKNGRYILHTDIVSFFESIKRETLHSFFVRNKLVVDTLKLSPDEMDLIMNLVLYKGTNLVVGSVASPVISNCVMYDFDLKIAEIVEKKSMKYTRYADDIIISSNSYIDKSILNNIDQLLEEYGFKRNISKTYFMSKHKRREVTGIIIDNNNNSLSLGRAKYLELKRDIYKYLVKSIGNVNQIKGMLAYLQDVDRKRYESLKNTYIKYDKNGEIFR